MRIQFYIALLVFVMTSMAVSAQMRQDVVVTPDVLSKTKEELIDRFSTERKSQYIIYLPMNYSKFLFSEKDKELFNDLKDTLVERIDLVYTVFRRSESFDQINLNKNRYEMLQSFFPQAFTNNLIEWHLIAQNGTDVYDEAQTYFHGFVIYLKPQGVTTSGGRVIRSVFDKEVDEETSRLISRNEEVSAIKALLEKSVGTKTVKDTTYKKIRKKVFTGFYLPKNKAKRKRGVKYRSPGPDRYRQYRVKTFDEMVVTEREVPDPTSTRLRPSHVLKQMSDDTVVYKVLDQSSARYADFVVVQDVTGSMHPYLTQTLLYLRTNMNATSTEKFVFFNDGDDAPDGPLGNTGGTYYVSSSDYNEIEQVAFTAMSKGTGGKHPENDIEACLYGIKKFPNCKGVVLIADNYSKVRDFRLMPQLMIQKKPVHVIICGITREQNVNIDYIYLAKYTNGSIQTIDDEITKLGSFKNGDVFKIGTKYFKIENQVIRVIKTDR